MNAIGYVQVSTEDQAREGVLLDNQKSKIQAYCLLKDLKLETIVEDAGISAKNLNRQGVQKVSYTRKEKQITQWFVYKLDRIFRSTTTHSKQRRCLRGGAYSIHSIEETLDTQSCNG
jgi:site-specific DNA recombinase